jgi:hypothetical protein
MSKFSEWLDSLDTIIENGKSYLQIPATSNPFFRKMVLNCPDNKWFYDSDTQSYWVSNE